MGKSEGDGLLKRGWFISLVICLVFKVLLVLKCSLKGGEGREHWRTA